MESSQTKIFLERTLCDAILKDKKTTIRSAVNLDFINTYPNGFLLKKIDINQGASFKIEMKDIRDMLSMSELRIDFPFKMGEKIEIIEKETNQYSTSVILNSVYIQRFREITCLDAINDGYSNYQNEIIELEDKYPGCDAELILLQKDWEKLYKNPVGSNIWTWVFGFKNTSIRASASTADLTESAIEALLSVKF